jgi:NTP pyrophosphatase (non-canonical NTP hydrolase)
MNNVKNTTKEDKSLNLTEFMNAVHINAVEHGWWDETKSFGDIIALCHSELSEALEEYRNKMPDEYYVINTIQESGDVIPEIRTDIGDDNYKGEKPEGIAVELADCIIRILYYCGFANIDIERVLQDKYEYNKTRPYKHGGKRM